MSHSKLYTFTATNTEKGVKAVMQFASLSVAYETRRMAKEAGCTVDHIEFPTVIYTSVEDAMDFLHTVCA